MPIRQLRREQRMAGEEELVRMMSTYSFILVLYHHIVCFWVIDRLGSIIGSGSRWGVVLECRRRPVHVPKLCLHL